jgi:hypothetical protein
MSWGLPRAIRWEAWVWRLPLWTNQACPLFPSSSRYSDISKARDTSLPTFAERDVRSPRDFHSCSGFQTSALKLIRQERFLDHAIQLSTLNVPTRRMLRQNVASESFLQGDTACAAQETYFPRPTLATRFHASSKLPASADPSLSPPCSREPRVKRHPRGKRPTARALIRPCLEKAIVEHQPPTHPTLPLSREVGAIFRCIAFVWRVAPR